MSISKMGERGNTLDFKGATIAVLERPFPENLSRKLEGKFRAIYSGEIFRKSLQRLRIMARLFLLFLK